MSEDLRGQRKFYGRVKGKALRKKQEERMNELLPTLEIKLAGERLNLEALFGNRNPLWLEIGFGGGEHLANIAAREEAINFIGSEPYINGVASCLRHIEEKNLQNIRLYPHDVRDLFEALDDAVFERIYLLYPDPWPKTRHSARRFMHPDNLREMARLLKLGGELRLATDIPEYVEHALEAISENTRFERVTHDIATPWDGWLETRYEAKAKRQGRKGHYLIFRRV